MEKMNLAEVIEEAKKNLTKWNFERGFIRCEIYSETFITTNSWFVIEIHETKKDPGKLKLWVKEMTPAGIKKFFIREKGIDSYEELMWFLNYPLDKIKKLPKNANWTFNLVFKGGTHLLTHND